MVVSCSAFGCTNTFKKSSKIGFYRFPAFPKDRKEKWIQACRRKDFYPSKSSRICGKHFVFGKPDRRKGHIDYVPSVFVFNQKKKAVNQIRDREARRMNRTMLSINNSDVCSNDKASKLSETSEDSERNEADRSGHVIDFQDEQDGDKNDLVEEHGKQDGMEEENGRQDLDLEVEDDRQNGDSEEDGRHDVGMDEENGGQDSNSDLEVEDGGQNGDSEEEDERQDLDLEEEDEDEDDEQDTNEMQNMNKYLVLELTSNDST